MRHIDRKKHWENIYTKKNMNEVSWYQPTPVTSLKLIEKSGLPKTAKIIDIGGGDSFLVDHLLQLGYSDITILDITEKAINKAKRRLGKSAKKVKWIVSDVTDFKPLEKYDLWHDRAAFHFLTEKRDIEKYLELIRNYIDTNGNLIIGTFSEKGPEKCSGINIQQYTEQTMTDMIANDFIKLECNTIDHVTPFGTVQNFIFCFFKSR